MIRTMQRAYWMVRACFGHVMGRWHYLRDAPDFYVAELAAVPEPGPGYEGPAAIYAEARRELALRIGRLERQARQSIEKAEATTKGDA